MHTAKKLHFLLELKIFLSVSKIWEGYIYIFCIKYLKRHVLRHHPKVLSWNDIQSRLINNYKIFIYYFKFSKSWWFFDLGYKLIRKLNNHDRFTLHYLITFPHDIFNISKKKICCTLFSKIPKKKTQFWDNLKKN